MENDVQLFGGNVTSLPGMICNKISHLVYVNESFKGWMVIISCMEYTSILDPQHMYMAIAKAKGVSGRQRLAGR